FRRSRFPRVEARLAVARAGPRDRHLRQQLRRTGGERGAPAGFGWALDLRLGPGRGVERRTILPSTRRPVRVQPRLMTFTQSALSVLIVVALALATVAVLLDIALLVALRRRRKDSAKLPQGERLELQLGTQGKQVQRLEAAVRRLAKGGRQLSETLRATIQHVAVVRFDAFEDMGGRLSFSAALLDRNGDGLVITSINGRQDTRCY